jgi:ABC-type Fe3+/spermidine/putrescine transport system ATPase subunit
MTGERKPIVEIINGNKKYGDNHVVHDFNLKIYEGEFLTMLGPSGCGKTTLLRMIGGFEEATDGQILYPGSEVSVSSMWVIVSRLRSGYDNLSKVHRRWHAAMSSCSDR